MSLIIIYNIPLIYYIKVNYFSIVLTIRSCYDFVYVLRCAGHLVSADFFHLLCTDPCCNDDE